MYQHMPHTHKKRSLGIRGGRCSISSQRHRDDIQPKSEGNEGGRRTAATDPRHDTTRHDTTGERREAARTAPRHDDVGLQFLPSHRRPASMTRLLFLPLVPLLLLALPFHNQLPPPVAIPVASAASTLAGGEDRYNADIVIDDERGGEVGGVAVTPPVFPVVDDPPPARIGDDGVDERHGGDEDDNKKATEAASDPSSHHSASESTSTSTSSSSHPTPPSSRSAYAASHVHRTSPTDPTLSRRIYPQSDPQVCLAFLSCCDRTDLLDSTVGAAIRHMEHDEPVNLRYEVAWVDNGSSREGTGMIEEKYQIERALVVEENMGLAWGMNALIFDLCRAPYILLLEEDWLYMDELVALQTPQRKRAVSTALALASSNLTSFDGRGVFGVFLRPETYGSFLKFPHAGRWETLRGVQLPGTATATVSSSSSSWNEEYEDGLKVDVDYRIYCSDPTLQSSGGWVWGSYTNGAALYSRRALHEVGRMYGEPQIDVFHDAYTEGNYAYRAGLKFCHAAVRLEPVGSRSCGGGGGDRDGGGEVLGRSTAAFYHIGGGRGTRRRKVDGTRCADESWFFYGTPTYEVYRERRRAAFPADDQQQDDQCTFLDRAAMSDARSRNAEGERFRAGVAEESREATRMEREKRDVMRAQARLIRDFLGGADDSAGDGDGVHDGDGGDVDSGRRLRLLREEVPWMADMTVGQIRDVADRLERLADSPHPVGGFWDGHGRPIVRSGGGGGDGSAGAATKRAAS